MFTYLLCLPFKESLSFLNEEFSLFSPSCATFNWCNDCVLIVCLLFFSAGSQDHFENIWFCWLVNVAFGILWSAKDDEVI